MLLSTIHSNVYTVTYPLQTPNDKADTQEQEWRVRLLDNFSVVAQFTQLIALQFLIIFVTLKAQ